LKVCEALSLKLNWFLKLSFLGAGSAVSSFSPSSPSGASSSPASLKAASLQVLN